ncbi:hypothetical protein LCGC14_1986260 [marine sediment metagenome]|uniref:Uncharacterized protein n=1 Tax=marine sediment metagenome TaxID=412755 RepID=A0A0F9FVJ5_9ZZZZ
MAGWITVFREYPNGEIVALFPEEIMDRRGNCVAYTHVGQHYAAHVNKYAEDHPNTLIIYITVMGVHYLKDEGLNLDNLHNIKWCKTEDIIYLWKRHND